MPLEKTIGQPCAGRSGRQGCDPAGASPAMSIVHVGHEATPHPGAGNRPGYAWCERPSGLVPIGRHGRSSLEAKRAWEPEGERMTAASRSAAPAQELLGGGHPVRRTRFPWGETVVLGEEVDTRNRGARRGMGPSAHARVAEIMSGRAVSQQGLVATCKDSPCKEESEATRGIRSGAWACRSDDGGVTPAEMTLEVILPRGSSSCGQRGPGHSAAESAARGDMVDPWGRHNFSRRPLAGGYAAVSRHGAQQTGEVRGACGPALQPPPGRAGRCSGKQRAGRGQNRTREIRPSGIAGGLWET